MRKAISIVLVMVLLVAMTGCNMGKKPAVTDDSKVTHTLSTEAIFEQSRKLSDEALNYYLGKDFDTAYTGLFYGIEKVTAENKIIYLDNKAASTALYYIQHGATYMGSLLDAQQADGGDADDLIGHMDISVVNLLSKHIFVNGELPNVMPFDGNLNISPEFTNWFIHQAQNSGVLDNRLKYNSGQTTTLSVDSKDCGPSSGGLTFNVFGETYTVSADEVGTTADEVKNSPNYNLEVETYKFFDSGLYTITYVTKSSEAVTERIRVTISFRYVEPSEKYEDDLNKFIAGVTDFKLIKHK